MINRESLPFSFYNLIKEFYGPHKNHMHYRSIS